MQDVLSTTVNNTNETREHALYLKEPVQFPHGHNVENGHIKRQQESFAGALSTAPAPKRERSPIAPCEEEVIEILTDNDGAPASKRQRQRRTIGPDEEVIEILSDDDEYYDPDFELLE